MTKRSARSLLLAAIGFTLVAPGFAGLIVRERASARAAMAPAAELAPDTAPPSAAVEQAGAIESAADQPPPPRETFEPIAALAPPLRSLESALRAGNVGPTDWSAQLSACADEWGGADRNALEARAVDESLTLPERLAALELLRALRADEAVELPPQQERELCEAALGPGAAGTTACAAAASLAAFASEDARSQLLAQLEQDADTVRASIALYGLRECARGCVLDELGEQLARKPGPAAQERLAAAAQGVARSIGELARDQAATPARAARLLEVARRDSFAPNARRRLFVAVASLGSAGSEAELCDIACDASTERDLALEIAQALRASPRAEAAALIDQRLATSSLDDERRERLAATSNFLRARDSRARP